MEAMAREGEEEGMEEMVAAAVEAMAREVVAMAARGGAETAAAVAVPMARGGVAIVAEGVGEMAAAALLVTVVAVMLVTMVAVMAKVTPGAKTAAVAVGMAVAMASSASQV